MKKYVLGFVFCMGESHVWLIRKNKPEFQKGKLNGVGGKVEDNETPEVAMRRECKEEFGLDIPHWDHFCTFGDGENYEIFCFKTYSDEPVTAMTDEVPELYEVDSINPYETLYNISWLVSMARYWDHYRDNKVVYEIKEKSIKSW